ncbi:hypothetical protein B0T13DRAFT_78651 [Neurospora crassa]|nr:hypothetical protein B0T13DRAFT_78651 [Neurospora crassa]
MSTITVIRSSSQDDDPLFQIPSPYLYLHTQICICAFPSTTMLMGSGTYPSSMRTTSQKCRIDHPDTETQGNTMTAYQLSEPPGPAPLSRQIACRCPLIWKCRSHAGQREWIIRTQQSPPCMEDASCGNEWFRRTGLRFRSRLERHLTERFTTLLIYLPLVVVINQHSRLSLFSFPGGLTQPTSHRSIVDRPATFQWTQSPRQGPASPVTNKNYLEVPLLDPCRQNFP